MTGLSYLASDSDISSRFADQWGRTCQTKAKTEWDESISSYWLSQWKLDAASQVLGLRCLQQNWDSYGSPAPSSKVVDTAIAVIQSIPFEDLPAPHVVPVAGGGVQFEWGITGRELELEVRPDGTIEFLKAERQKPLEEGKVSGSTHLALLLAWLQWGERVYSVSHSGFSFRQFITRALAHLYARMGR